MMKEAGKNPCYALPAIFQFGDMYICQLMSLRCPVAGKIQVLFRIRGFPVADDQGDRRDQEEV